MPVVVSDASVLISLGAIGELSLLADSYERVFIPGAVWQEVAGLGPRLAGASEVISARQEGWLQVGKPESQSLALQLKTSLDAGEAEAIGLAFELQAELVLIDETEGRAAAKALGLAVAGTLGVLVRARHEGKVRHLKPLLDQLVAHHGFRLARRLYEGALVEVGETP